MSWLSAYAGRPVIAARKRRDPDRANCSLGREADASRDEVVAITIAIA
jgi:hypothetical protein